MSVDWSNFFNSLSWPIEQTAETVPDHRPRPAPLKWIVSKNKPACGEVRRRKPVALLACYHPFEAMSDPKESAFRYDLFVTPAWRDRFDALINESVTIPLEVRILDVNCGTGAHAIELAERMHGKGEVIGLDPSAERIAIARAKALVKKVTNVKFEQGIASNLPFDSHEFEIVIGDASMIHADEVEDLLAEMVRVARAEGRVILKLTTRGTFDEFFSLYWEALYATGMADEVWASLERLINERHTVSAAETLADQSGLRSIESFTSREELNYDTSEDFLESPLIADHFMGEWLEIVPAESRAEVLGHLSSIIERERNNTPFYVSVKAAVITGIK